MLACLKYTVITKLQYQISFCSQIQLKCAQFIETPEYHAL
jgi:hypothetical protein